MATRTNKESVQLSLTIDGKPAENTIQNLDKQTEALVREMQALEQQGLEATEAYRKLKVQKNELLKQSNQAYEANKRAAEQQARLAVNEGKSLKDLQREYRHLNAILSNLPPTHKDFNANVELLHAKKAKIDEIKASFKAVKEEIEDAGNATGGVGGKLLDVGDLVTGGLLTGGITAAVDLAIDAGQAVAETVREVKKFREEVHLLTGAVGDELDEQVIRARSLGKTFEEEQSEILASTNAIAKEFGISFDVASKRIEEGFLAGAAASPDFLDNIKEYSVQFAAAGFSAEEFIAISTRAAKEGVFSDKGLDVVKEFGLRIREQTTATKDAMIGAFGQEFTTKLFEGLNKGSLTSVDALKLVAGQMDETQIPARQLQTVIADVFGGPGEDAGLRYIQQLRDIEGATLSLIDPTDEFTKQRIQLQAANEELARSENDLAKQLTDTGNSLTVFWKTLKSGAFNVLVDVLKFFEQFSATWKGITAAVEQIFTNAVNRVKIFVTDVEIAFANVSKLNPFGKTGAQIDAEIAALQSRKGALAAEAKSAGRAYHEAFVAGLSEIEARKAVAAADAPGASPTGGGRFKGQDVAALNAAEKERKKKEDAERKEAERLAEAQAYRAKQAALLQEMQLLAPLETEQVEHTEQAKLDLKADFAERAGEILQGEADKFAALEEYKAQKAQETADKLNAIEQAKFQFAQQTFSGIVQLLSADEAARKKNAKAIKAFTIGQIYVNLFEEISGIWKNSTTLGPVIGPIFGAIQTAFAVTRAQIAVSNVAKQKYAKGGVIEGARHAEGGIQLFDTRSRQVVGEMEGGEPILSRDTYRNNKPVIDKLLYSSMYRGGAPIFATGGVFNTPTSLASQASLSQSTQRTEQLYEAMLAEQMRTRQAIEAIPTTLTAKVSVQTIETESATLGDIRKAASL